MEISPENDQIFGYKEKRSYDDPFIDALKGTPTDIKVRRYGKWVLPNGKEPAMAIDIDELTLVLALDDAEEVAYRILYAVNKLRKETPDE